MGKILSGWMSFIRKIIFRVVRVGPIPTHIAMIMNGNRRYAEKKKLDVGAGHDAGALALSYVLDYCYELGIKYLTVYAFSTDNFKRNPNEVKKIMDLLKDCIPLLTRITKIRPMRVHFAGNLNLLSADLRAAALILMGDTADQSKFVFTICVCYSSSDEIIHAVRECCKEKCGGDHDIQEIRPGFDVNGNGNGGLLADSTDDDNVINMVDIGKHMYMAIAPDPDILIRTGDEYRLSNFLLWQTSCSYLCCLRTLWPEFGIFHLLWVILNFQRKHLYFEKKKKLL